MYASQWSFDWFDKSAPSGSPPVDNSVDNLRSLQKIPQKLVETYKEKSRVLAINVCGLC
jgi:hypothetical protein